MKKIELDFIGYTWDEYFYVIANKSGILVAYRGGLDSEGSIKLDEIIYVDEADQLGAIYESKQFAEVRKSLSKNDRLFYSYAEIKTMDRIDIIRIIKSSIWLGSVNNDINLNVQLTCNGSCALFPKELLK